VPDNLFKPSVCEITAAQGRRNTGGLPTALGTTLPPWYEELAPSVPSLILSAPWVMLSHTSLWDHFHLWCSRFRPLLYLLYRPQAWGRAVMADLFTGAGIMFTGVIWFALLGAGESSASRPEASCLQPICGGMAYSPAPVDSRSFAATSEIIDHPNPPSARLQTCNTSM
jgi:hypothetical protein